MKKTIESIHHKFCLSGLDICQPFCVQDYNFTQLKKDWLPTFDRESTTGILIGNSRGLWNHFLGYLLENQRNIESDNPLDDYIKQTVSSVSSDSASEFKVRIESRYSTGMGCEFVNMVKLAKVSGLAYDNPTAHISIHPVFGPWFALPVLSLDWRWPSRR